MRPPLILALMVLGMLVPVAPAPAATRPITGTLDRSGTWTVVALAADGSVRVATTRAGRFSLRPTATRVTLHLRAPDGTYAGPVVVGRRDRGRRAVVGVRAGARLGTLVLSRRQGYTRTKRRPARRAIVETWRARARDGVPIGAGRYGRVRTTVPRSETSPGDLDLDGIPDLLDIDDDGDRLLDRFDRRTARPRGRATTIDDQFLFQTDLSVPLDLAVNANAGALSLERADAVLVGSGFLQLGIIPADLAELDCGTPQSRTDPALGGLVYCTRGGTARHFLPGAASDDLRRFPEAFDPDGDGFGTMTPSNPDPAPGSGQLAMFLRHGATSAQIGTGDLLVQRVTRGGMETQYAAAVQFVFGTVPAPVSLDDGHGNRHEFRHPVSGHPTPGPGMFGNPLPVTAPAGKPVVVTIRLWRPQRRPIPPETAPWIDLGRLNYYAAVDGGRSCPQDAYATRDDELRPLVREDVFPHDYAGVRDLSGDRVPNIGEAITFDLDLTRCLSALGTTLEPGVEHRIAVLAQAPNGGDKAETSVMVVRR